ncbi:MAG: hypothetical protein AB7H77_02000 [Bdellovibrionales bacterium]
MGKKNYRRTGVPLEIRPVDDVSEAYRASAAEVGSQVGTFGGVVSAVRNGTGVVTGARVVQVAAGQEQALDRALGKMVLDGIIATYEDWSDAQKRDRLTHDKPIGQRQQGRKGRQPSMVSRYIVLNAADERPNGNGASHHANGAETINGSSGAEPAAVRTDRRVLRARELTS